MVLSVPLGYIGPFTMGRRGGGGFFFFFFSDVVRPRVGAVEYEWFVGP